ncbi:MAG: HEPN domain-containing protein [Clostridiales bacterium]|jgi:HEPN domain-containing protein|nr:HEPN domain-containing protein [Clostridiales bacterium]
MGSKEDILQQWFDKGKDDLRSAEYLSTMHNPTPDEVICYLCQQSAEKYLKGFMFSHDIEPDKIHDLKDLLEICQKYNTGFSTLSSEAYILTRYAVLPRYPNELGITNEDMKTALNYAKSIQEFVLGCFSAKQENSQ